MEGSRRDFLKGLIVAGMSTYGFSQNIAEANTGKLVLPYVGEVSLRDKILNGGHFNWAEATKNGTRIPNNEKIVKGILEAANFMEEVRDYFGNKPITVNSWYRDPVSNKKVGGEENSKHLEGIAVDFVVRGVNPIEVYDRLNPHWGNRGGLGKYHNFTHIDSRGHGSRWGKI